MATNKDHIAKGLKFLLGTLPLLFIGPSIIYNAFMNQHTLWHYLVLGIGISICIIAMWLMHRGLKWVTKGIFND